MSSNLGLEYLPIEVHTNLFKLREIDIKLQIIEKHTDRLIDEYLKNDFPSEAKKKERLAYIESLHAKANRYSDNKVKMSYETYELIDKSIKRLDLYLSRFENEIKQKAAIIAMAADHHCEANYCSTTNTKEEEHKKKKPSKKSSGNSRDRSSGSSRSSSSSSSSSNSRNSSSSNSSNSSVIGRSSRSSRRDSRAKNKGKRKAADASSGEDRSRRASKRHQRKSDSNMREPVRGPEACKIVSILPDDIYDMPVDPHEPVYCICRQVSYGDMIACDDPECLIEWFHFSCVGLTTIPRGKWFCHECKQNKRN